MKSTYMPHTYIHPRPLRQVVARKITRLIHILTFFEFLSAFARALFARVLFARVFVCVFAYVSAYGLRVLVCFCAFLRAL